MVNAPETQPREHGYEFESCSFYDLPGSLPTVPAFPDDLDAVKVAQEWMASFSGALERQDGKALEDCFIADSFFRDQLALTGNFRTFHTPVVSAAALLLRVKATGARGFANRLEQPGGPRIVRPSPSLGWVEGRFTFTISKPAASCSGGFRLVLEDEKWKAWTVATVLEQLDSHLELNPYTGKTLDILQPAVDGPCPLKGKRNHELPTPAHPIEVDVAIFGAGAAGLSMAGRCEGFDLSYVVFDRYAKPGDNWSLRYDKAVWHTAKYTGALPYQRMTPEHPFLMDRLSIAHMLNRYVDELGLNFCGDSTIKSATWSESDQRWTVIVNRAGQECVVVAKFFVQCTGTGSQVPYIPPIANRSVYKGEAVHSNDFTNAKAYKGKRVIIVGSANTAHDIAEDFEENGAAHITMIQRSTTYILPAEYICDQAIAMYNDKFPCELADRMQFTSPAVPSRWLLRTAHKARSDKESHRYNGLAERGFKFITSSNGGDIAETLYVHAGRHYIDTGASAKIIAGKIDVKSDSPVKSFTETGFVCEDGTRLDADVIVYCTGFSDKDMSLTAKGIVDKKSASLLGPTWGIDQEAEMRGMWRPSGHPAYFFHGGGTGQCRFYSRQIALQIKAALTGQRLEVYKGMPNVDASAAEEALNGTATNGAAAKHFDGKKIMQSLP